MTNITQKIDMLYGEAVCSLWYNLLNCCNKFHDGVLNERVVVCSFVYCCWADHPHWRNRSRFYFRTQKTEPH